MLIRLELYKNQKHINCKVCLSLFMPQKKSGVCCSDSCTATLKTRSTKPAKQRLISFFGGSCQHCGYCKNSAALCFHHKDPKTKSFGLGGSVLASKYWEEILEEARKCILLCSNCHMELHHPE